MALDDNPSGFVSMTPAQPIPAGFAYAQPQQQQQQQQQQPTIVVMQSNAPSMPTTTPLTNLRILVVACMIVGSFALLAYSWGLWITYNDHYYNSYNPFTVLMVFLKIVFPIMHGLLWLAGLAIVFLPASAITQALWFLVGCLHVLVSLAGVVHFFVVFAMHFEFMMFGFLLVVWVPVLQLVEIFLVLASFSSISNYRLALKQEAEVGGAMPMTVFAAPADGAMNV